MSSEYAFCVDYDKRGAAKCKKCKQKLEKTALRIAKLASNPFSEDGGLMKNWFHVDCLFESFLKARATTKKVDDPAEDIDGFKDIEEKDQKLIRNKVKEYEDAIASKNKGKPKKDTPKKDTPKKDTPKKDTPKKDTPKKDTSIKDTPKKNSSKKDISAIDSPKGESPIDTTSKEANSPSVKLSDKEKNTPKNSSKEIHKDEMFKEFRRLCANIAEVSSYLSKTEIVSKFFKEGSDGKSFKGNLKLNVRLLLPGVVKRVYNLQSKTLIKLFSQMFGANYELMLEDLEKGDVAETIKVFFDSSKLLRPAKKSLLSLQEVDDYLEELKDLTTEETQSDVLKRIAKRCTSNDLKMIIRLVKGDLRINAGSKHILEGIHPDAYEAFQVSRDIDLVMDQILNQDKGSPQRLKMQSLLMTPVLPMLAEACKSVEMALKKCPNGMYAEIKYDGERVQLHKKGSDFKFFSRSLKPVMPHKVSTFKSSIPQAFPEGADLILDAEVLLIDTKTNMPLPFGSLGKHKKNAYQDANVCLFIFDCLHYNGQDLMEKPLSERRRILEQNMTEIHQRVLLSEMKIINKAAELQKMIDKVFDQGLEGLVLKSLQSVYEPGKRHWLKVKKDYLHGGAMADSADLVVLGAWYGTGKKGGMMSVFLMGCYDPAKKKWCTVTKVHTGHDDATLERLQTILKMEKISQNYENLPSWINCSRALTPDFICKDPKNSPVWEISGAEFTQNNNHTANGISIRFPRVTKIRDDKDWKNSTDLTRLQKLFEKSKEHSDYVGLGSDDEEKGQNSETPKKRKKEMSPGPKAKKKKTSDSSPKETSNGDNEFVAPVKNPLPSAFKGVRMYISPADEELLRYFIAYGGETVDEFSSDATHVVLNKKAKKQNSKTAKVVTNDWLWNCIKSAKLLPID